MDPSFINRLDDLRRLGMEKPVPEGVTLQHQSETVGTYSLILRGNLRAFNVTSQGTLIWIDDFSAGDLIGCEIFGLDKEALFYIITTSDATLLTFSDTRLENMSETDPTFQSYIIQKLSDQITARTSRMIDGLALSSFGRACSELKRLSRPSGTNPGLHVIRPIPVFSELGLRVGATRETVSRTVSKLTKQGVLVREPGALLIPDLTRLEDLIL